MGTAFVECFWNIAEKGTALIVPILALFLVFRLVHDIMWRN